MEKKEILNKNKKDLKTIISKLPKHYQPKWLYKGTKDELAGFLMTAIQIPSLNDVLDKLSGVD